MFKSKKKYRATVFICALIAIINSLFSVNHIRPIQKTKINSADELSASRDTIRKKKFRKHRKKQKESVIEKEAVIIKPKVSWADSIFNILTVDQKIGQLFMVAAFSNKGKAHTEEIENLFPLDSC